MTRLKTASTYLISQKF